MFQFKLAVSLALSCLLFTLSASSSAAENPNYGQISASVTQSKFPISGVSIDVFSVTPDGDRDEYLLSMQTGQDGRTNSNWLPYGCYILTFIAPSVDTWKANEGYWINRNFCLTPEVRQVHVEEILKQRATITQKGYYLASAKMEDAYSLGCSMLDPTAGWAVVYVGRQERVGDEYGFTFFHGTDLSMDEFSIRVQQIVQGASECHPNNKLRIAVGGSNDRVIYFDESWLRGHAEAYAIAINNLNEWASSNYGNVSVYGTWDMEQWGKETNGVHDGKIRGAYGLSKAWIDAYDDAANRSILIQASLDGCPSEETDSAHHQTNVVCTEGDSPSDAWTYEHYLDVIWRPGRASPMPQAYYDTYTMHRQWRQLADYAYHANNIQMSIFGVLTQEERCQGSGGNDGCLPGHMLSPEQSVSELSALLNAHQTTRDHTALYNLGTDLSARIDQ